ncbi:MAG: cbb3-type cytochrome oxidase subunit 3 [Granulosicoccus sp.]|jgi:cbb3-type cytochrome oxidase subunit 3
MLKQYFTKILLVCLVAVAAYIYHQDRRYNDLVAENQQLSVQLDQVKTLLRETEEKVVLLEKNSIEGMLEETNEVVVSGWETLLDAVKEELTKAKKRFNEEANKMLEEGAVPPAKSRLPDDDASSIIEGERT